MTEYRIPLNTGISQETMRAIDEYAKREGGAKKLSRGEVVDRAISALVAASSTKKARG